MRRYLSAGIFAYVVLTVAAIWLGGLNQDEGWYLYAANLVAEGKVPYRDFAYTQGPMLPIVYSVFAWIWKSWGLLGARIFTALLGAISILLFMATAMRTVPRERRGEAAVAVLLLLGSNLYHLYYTAIPKTYALASLFVAIGYFLLTFGSRRLLFLAGIVLAFAAGTRISLGALLAVVGFALLFDFRARRWDFLWFGLGGTLGLAIVYGPFLLDPVSFTGLVAAQKYHAARGGFDPVFTIGSLSRLVRWYLPVFIVAGLGFAFARKAGGDGSGLLPSHAKLLLWSFGAVFAVQMLAPFPYEDYQVPIIGLLTVAAVQLFFRSQGGLGGAGLLLILGLAWAGSFGSPLLEKWTTNGQDRFWTMKKPKCELAQLQDVARQIRTLDPDSDMIFTQDLYLAIELGRKVPDGLEMGPFSMLSKDEWRRLIESAPCRIAAFSGYGFSIDPPACNERSVNEQMEYWKLLKKNYTLSFSEDMFGQNATTLLVLEKRVER